MKTALIQTALALMNVGAAYVVWRAPATDVGRFSTAFCAGLTAGLAVSAWLKWRFEGS